MAGFGPFVERFMTALTPARVLVFGTPSDPLREALAGLGAVYSTPIGGFHR